MAALLVHVAGWDGALSYQRQLIEQGQLWRLLTCHLAHLGTTHLLENLAALWFIALLCADQFTPRRWLLILLLCALAISFALYFFSPAIPWYVGLSGTLHGLLTAGLVAQLRQPTLRKFALLLLGAVAAKVLWEQWVGPLPGSESLAGGRVIVDAHLYGTIAGALTALLLSITTKLQATTSTATSPSD